MKRFRDEDARSITARVAAIDTQVLYLRKNVCEILKENVSHELTR